MKRKLKKKRNKLRDRMRYNLLWAIPQENKIKNRFTDAGSFSIL